MVLYVQFIKGASLVLRCFWLLRGESVFGSAWSPQRIAQLLSSVIEGADGATSHHISNAWWAQISQLISHYH